MDKEGYCCVKFFYKFCGGFCCIFNIFPCSLSVGWRIKRSSSVILVVWAGGKHWCRTLDATILYPSTGIAGQFLVFSIVMCSLFGCVLLLVLALYQGFSTCCLICMGSFEPWGYLNYYAPLVLGFWSLFGKLLFFLLLFLLF